MDEWNFYAFGGSKTTSDSHMEDHSERELQHDALQIRYIATLQCKYLVSHLYLHYPLQFFPFLLDRLVVISTKREVWMHITRGCWKGQIISHNEN